MITVVTLASSAFSGLKPQLTAKAPMLVQPAVLNFSTWAFRPKVCSMAENAASERILAAMPRVVRRASLSR